MLEKILRKISGKYIEFLISVRSWQTGINESLKLKV